MTQSLVSNAPTWFRALCIALLYCAACPVLAQTYPAKPITLIVPFPAGGATDVQARALAQAAGQDLKQQIVVTNQPGASGTLGPATMARQAAPDGDTIALAPGTLWRQPHLQKVSYDALADFTCIAAITSYTHGIVVRQDAFRKATDSAEFERQLALQDQPKTYLDSRADTAFAAKSFAEEKRVLGELKIKLDE